MKKIMAVVVLGIALLCLTGCGSEKKETTSDDGFIDINECFKEITLVDCWGNQI